ncbi:MAG: c-type cytochrome [Aquabacterium sp.]
MIYASLAAACLMSPWWSLAAPAKARAAAGQTKPQQPSLQQRSPQPDAGDVGDAVLGRDKADAERCIECHGADGQGAGHGNGPEGKFAKLAGQHAAYMLKQIRDFRSGARKHDQMAIMARSVSDEDVRDIAAWFASLPAMKPDGGAQGDVPNRGRQLYAQGDAARGITACITCHDDKGQGTSGQPLIPVIGGQEWRYLDKQLRDWRSGERRNGPDAAMNQAAKALNDNEIEALASYLSGM